MVKADQVPSKSWIAMQSVIGDHVPVETLKRAFAEAINAWPNAKMQHHTVPPASAIILPLPPEKETSE